MERRFGSQLTADDRLSPDSRPSEAKWRNRASYERIRMVRDGTLSSAADGYWELTGR
jgi:hypothetical protein